MAATVFVPHPPSKMVRRLSPGKTRETRKSKSWMKTVHGLMPSPSTQALKKDGGSPKCLHLL